MSAILLAALIFAASVPAFAEDGGVTDGIVENSAPCPHNRVKTVCADCGEEVEGYFLGSVLSNGYVSIVGGILFLAAGFVGGIVVGKKKKPNEEEE